MGLACPVCGDADRAPVFALGNVAVLCDQLWPDAEAARAAPSGDVDLVACHGGQFLTIEADPVAPELRRHPSRNPADSMRCHV